MRKIVEEASGQGDTKILGPSFRAGFGGHENASSPVYGGSRCRGLSRYSEKPRERGSTFGCQTTLTRPKGRAYYYAPCYVFLGDVRRGPGNDRSRGSVLGYELALCMR